MVSKIKINLKWIVVFLSIFFITNSTVLFGTNGNYTFIQISYIYLFVSSIMLLLLLQRVNRKRMMVGIAMSAIIIFTSIINRDFPMSTFIVIMLVINGLLISDYISFDEFAFHFDNILYFITIISLVLSLLVFINRGMFSVFPSIKNSNQGLYKNMILFVIEDYTGEVYRNQSLFREPGVFQTYLSLGLVFQMFVLENKSIRRMIVYFIALATTLSTTGYISAGILFIYLITSYEVSKRRYKVLAVVAILLILGYLLFFTNFLKNDSSGYSVFGKVASFKLIGNYLEIGGAAVARIASVVMDIYIAINHIIFGYGTTHIINAYPELSRNLYGTRLLYTTETLFLQAARYGAFYFFFWITGYFRLAKKLSKKKYYSFATVFVSLLIMLITESYIYNVLVYVLLFYGLFNNEAKIVENRAERMALGD